MTLSPREQRLAAIVGALGVVLVVWFAWQAYRGAIDRREAQLDAARADFQKKQDEISVARRESRKLEDWEARSLPRDRELARSLYQNWLVAELNRAKLKQVTVEPGRGTQLRDVYTKLPFTVRARGGLEQIGNWLAGFYRADHLQQIRDLTLQPAGEGGDLQLTASIEAISLHDAPAERNTLSDKPSARLTATDAAAAVKAIVDRNVFAPYVPPPPPPPPPQTVVAPPPPPPAFDPAKYTFLTSIISVDTRPQAWLNVRPTKQLLRLYEGDSISVGRFNGKLVRIGSQEIEIEADGKRRIVALGKSLEQAVELPGSGT